MKISDLSDKLKGTGRAFALASMLGASMPALGYLTPRTASAASMVGGDYERQSSELSKACRGINSVVSQLDEKDKKQLEKKLKGYHIQPSKEVLKLDTPNVKDLTYSLSDGSFAFTFDGQRYVCNGEPDIKLAAGPEPLNVAITDAAKCNTTLQQMFPTKVMSYEALKPKIERLYEAKKGVPGWDTKSNSVAHAITTKTSDGLILTYIVGKNEKGDSVRIIVASNINFDSAYGTIFYKDGNMEVINEKFNEANGQKYIKEALQKLSL